MEAKNVHAMRRKLSITLFSILISMSTWAQNCPPAPYIDFLDSQFEHTGANSNIGTDWGSCGGDPSDQWGTADIQPIKPPTGQQIGVSVPPKAGNGSTYLGFFACWDRNKATEKSYNWQEIIYQKLGKPMKAGTTYRIAIDVMVPETRYEYDQWPGGNAFTQYTCTPTHTILRRQTKPGAITIRGGNAAGGCRANTTVLWKSPTVQNDSKWVSFEFTITPTKDYAYFVIAPEIPDEVTSAGEIRDYICIDNVHSIKPDSIKTTVTHVTCPGANNGTGQVILSPKVNLPATITWSNGQTTKDIKDLKPGKYYVVVTDAKGFIMCDSILVKDAKPFTIDSTVVNVKCFGGNDGSATVNTTAKAPVTYLWNPGGQTSATATGLSAGTYTCTVKDSAGCPQTKVVTVKEPTKITATATHTDVTVPKGSDGTATVVNPTGGTPPYTYLWDDSKKQTTQTATDLKSGTYTCTITDKNGCTFKVTVIIIEPPLFVVKVDTLHVTCFNGTDGHIVIHASKGTAPYTYTWNPNVSQDSVGNNLKAGVYTIDVKDAKDVTVTITVTIRQPDELTADISGKNIVCNGDHKGEATISNVKGGVPAYNYLWTPGGATTSSIKDLGPGTYSCTITDAHGCTLTKSVTLTEPEPLIISHVLTNISCFGYTDGKAVITANGGVKPYLYYLDPAVSGQSDSTFKDLKAGSYTYSVHDKNGCITAGAFVLTEPPSPVISVVTTPVTCNQGSDGTVVLTVTNNIGTVVYNWQPGDATTPNLDGQKAGTYICTIVYNSGACTTTATAIVKEPEPVVVKADPVTICYGSAAVLTAHDATGGNGAPYSYECNTPNFIGNPYTINPTTTTSYVLVATDAKGCKSAPVTAIVTVREQLRVIALKPQTVCAGTPVTLNATAAGGNGNYFYQWAPAGTGSTASVTVTPLVTTLYTVTLSDDCGTPPVTDTVRITVIQKPVVEFDADIRMGCPVLCVKFSNKATATGDVIKEWLWDFGDGMKAHEQDPSHCYSKPGKYTVSLYVKTAHGCDNILVKPDYIEVYPVPVADFTFSPDQPTLNYPSVTFTDHSIIPAKWNWDFGDKDDLTHNTSLLQHPAHTYSDTGRYCINLAIASDKGCTAQTAKCLYVIPECTIYVPNAFTPGVKDGVNDHFYAKGTFIKTFKMYIFDRWGMLIFTSDDLYKGWAGDVKGSGLIAQQDVYVWKIIATDYFNKKHELIGTVTLVQ
jgi:gliding motility-associated-like protein